MTELAAILLEARALIDTREKWCSYGWGEDERRCVVQALVGACAPSEAYSALATETGVWSGSLGLWNDLDSTTHADVMAAFDRAIEAAQ